MRGERTQMPCRHCGVAFETTIKAAERVLNEGRGGYCTPICKAAAIDARRVRPKDQGPCPTCGNTFQSRHTKTYCSMACWIASPKRAEEIKKRAAAKVQACLECGQDFSGEPWRKRKYCSSSCYRAYQAKRFDRFVANPDGICIEQAFDEFLTQDELPCPMPGCDWVGHSLSHHMNFTHGVKKGDFKRAAGFNLTSGIISAPRRERLKESSAGFGDPTFSQRVRGTGGAKVGGYISKEAREHKAKAMALVREEAPLKVSTCPVCRTTFDAPPVGHKTYCTVACRDVQMMRRRKAAKESLDAQA